MFGERLLNGKGVAIWSTIEDFELTNQLIKVNIDQCATEQLKEGIQAGILSVLSQSVSEFNGLKMICDCSR